MEAAEGGVGAGVSQKPREEGRKCRDEDASEAQVQQAAGRVVRPKKGRTGGLTGDRVMREAGAR